jgi:hypothetical protein
MSAAVTLRFFSVSCDQVIWPNILHVFGNIFCKILQKFSDSLITWKSADSSSMWFLPKLKEVL